MHVATLVLGEVEAAMKRVKRKRRNMDWWGIGGRFTGSLMARPGATSAKVWGDTMPELEAGLFSQMGGGFARPTGSGSGVDQVRMGELDVEATGRLSELFLMVIGQDFIIEPSNDSLTLMSMSESIGEAMGGPVAERTAKYRAELKPRADATAEEWHATVAGIIDKLPADTLLTVVDVHF